MKLAVLLLLRQFERAHHLLHGYPDLITRLRQERFDLVIANDIESLPLAFRMGHAGKVLWDAHEYAPRHFEDRWWWRVFFQDFNRYLCRTYIPRCDAMTTIGQGLADEYEKHFKLKPVVITNATNFRAIAPSTTSPDRIRLVHHGIANISRQTHLMFDLVDLLDERFTLDLYLIMSDYANAQSRRYLSALKTRAADHPRINIHPPIPSDEIVTVINQYDVGVFLLPPVNFNYANTLPNKFFDFIQARLAIAIGPSPEMGGIIAKYETGVIAEDFTAGKLAAALAGLSAEQISLMKSNAARAAAELSAEKNEAVLQHLVKGLLTNRRD